MDLHVDGLETGQLSLGTKVNSCMYLPRDRATKYMSDISRTHEKSKRVSPQSVHLGEQLREELRKIDEGKDRDYVTISA